MTALKYFRFITLFSYTIPESIIPHNIHRLIFSIEHNIHAGSNLIWFRFDFRFKIFNWDYVDDVPEREGGWCEWINPANWDDCPFLLVMDDLSIFSHIKWLRGKTNNSNECYNPTIASATLNQFSLSHISALFTTKKKLQKATWVYLPLADDSWWWKVAQCLHRIILNKRFAEVCEVKKRRKRCHLKFIKIHFPIWWFSWHEKIIVVKHQNLTLVDSGEKNFSLHLLTRMAGKKTHLVAHTLTLSYS